MPNTPGMQQALASESAFRARVRQQVLLQAGVVLAEGTGVANHTTRKAYALQVIANPDLLLNSIVAWIVTRGNVLGANTTAVINDQAARAVVVTDATDAALFSQIATDWDTLSGV